MISANEERQPNFNAESFHSGQINRDTKMDNDSTISNTRYEQKRQANQHGTRATRITAAGKAGTTGQRAW